MLEKNGYSCSGEWNFLCMSVSEFVLQFFCKYTVSCLIFCLDDLSIFENGVWKSLTIIVLLFISPFCSVSTCFI